MLDHIATFNDHVPRRVRASDLELSQLDELRNYNCPHIRRSHGAHNEASAKAQRGEIRL